MLDGDECDRTSQLDDGNHIQIMARLTGAGGPDLCAMADAATDHAWPSCGWAPSRAAPRPAAHPARLQPAANWGPKKAEHGVSAVRTRLSRDGVPFLTREQIGEPVGSTLGELLLSPTLVPPDLALLDLPGAPDGSS